MGRHVFEYRGPDPEGIGDTAARLVADGGMWQVIEYHMPFVPAMLLPGGTDEMNALGLAELVQQVSIRRREEISKSIKEHPRPFLLRHQDRVEAAF